MNNYRQLCPGKKLFYTHLNVKSPMDLTIVIPLYNEEESLEELVAWINKVMENRNWSYEVIMVDDGSTDHSWSIVESLSEKNPQVRGIKFRRNYGKAAALNTGFEYATGEVIITMDADLQDNPEEIPELYRMIKEDHFDFDRDQMAIVGERTKMMYQLGDEVFITLKNADLVKKQLDYNLIGHRDEHDFPAAL